MNHATFVDAEALWLEAEATGHAKHDMPLFHRWVWAEHHKKSRHRLLIVRDLHGSALPCVAVQIDRSRVLPMHHHLRVLRFGHGLRRELWEPTIAGLAELARRDPKVLRLNISVFSRENRSELAMLLAQSGFRKAAHAHAYRHTLTVDLTPDKNTILQGLHKTARKNLRAVEKSPLVVRVLNDARYADRIQQLQSESMNRTGSRNPSLDWSSVLDLSRLHPEMSRVVGIFKSGSEFDPQALIGFGWGCMHGDHGEYRAAGTTRTANTNLPLSYPLLWDLMGWAKEQGGTWFDLGGVTLGDSETDPLAGISDFKRYFSRNVEEVGEEWTLEPHPARSQLATLLRRGVRGSANVLDRVTKTSEQLCRTI